MLDTDGDGAVEYAEFVQALYRLIDGNPFQHICLLQMGMNAIKHMVHVGFLESHHRATRAERLLLALAEQSGLGIDEALSEKPSSVGRHAHRGSADSFWSMTTQQSKLGGLADVLPSAKALCGVSSFPGESGGSRVSGSELEDCFLSQKVSSSKFIRGRPSDFPGKSLPMGSDKSEKLVQHHPVKVPFDLSRKQSGLEFRSFNDAHDTRGEAELKAEFRSLSCKVASVRSEVEAAIQNAIQRQVHQVLGESFDSMQRACEQCEVEVGAAIQRDVQRVIGDGFPEVGSSIFSESMPSPTAPYSSLIGCEVHEISLQSQIAHEDCRGSSTKNLHVWALRDSATKLQRYE